MNVCYRNMKYNHVFWGCWFWPSTFWCPTLSLINKMNPPLCIEPYLHQSTKSVWAHCDEVHHPCVKRKQGGRRQFRAVCGLAVFVMQTCQVWSSSPVFFPFDIWNLLETSHNPDLTFHWIITSLWHNNSCDIWLLFIILSIICLKLQR